jgi:hypothetical protein
MANLVEHPGGAIVSPHSQSGIHVLHMIRILRERGKLDLVKGIIIPESAIGLATFANAGITPKDFDHIPFLLMNGDYRPGTARVANREMVAAINASPTRTASPATYVDLDDPKFGGKYLGTTHMNMIGTTSSEVFDFALEVGWRRSVGDVVCQAAAGSRRADVVAIAEIQPRIADGFEDQIADPRQSAWPGARHRGQRRAGWIAAGGVPGAAPRALHVEFDRVAAGGVPTDAGGALMRRMRRFHPDHQHGC